MKTGKLSDQQIAKLISLVKLSADLEGPMAYPMLGGIMAALLAFKSEELVPAKQEPELPLEEAK